MIPCREGVLCYHASICSIDYIACGPIGTDNSVLMLSAPRLGAWLEAVPVSVGEYPVECDKQRMGLQLSPFLAAFMNEKARWLSVSNRQFL